MGMSANAHLAYGYSLGSSEKFLAVERDEYDAPKLPWLPLDEDDECDYSDFGGKVEAHLLAEVAGFTEVWMPDGSGFWRRQQEAQERVGVELKYSGHYDYSGWVLIATGSERSVEWSEVMTLDAAAIAVEQTEWNAKLATALAALGLTPTQDGPRWLVYPSYG